MGWNQLILGVNYAWWFTCKGSSPTPTAVRLGQIKSDNLCDLRILKGIASGCFVLETDSTLRLSANVSHWLRRGCPVSEIYKIGLSRSTRKNPIRFDEWVSRMVCRSPGIEKVKPHVWNVPDEDRGQGIGNRDENAWPLSPDPCLLFLWRDRTWMSASTLDRIHCYRIQPQLRRTDKRSSQSQRQVHFPVCHGASR